MTPAQLADAVRGAVVQAVQAGDLDVEVPSSVLVERPRVRAHGDYATNVALQLAKQAGRPPREVAGLLATRLAQIDGIDGVDVAGPGFLNIRLTSGAMGALAGRIVAAGAGFGTADVLAEERINLEFVSANPTGPIHLGGTRWAAVGDALARILAAQGAEVTREYYFNDHGGQIDRFARSLLAAARHEPAPEDGYGGAYIGEIAQQVLALRPDALSTDDPQEVFRAVGVDLMFGQIKKSLHDFGVDFDVFFHENSLHASGAVDKAVARLEQLGQMYDADGARWLRTTSYGDDKDRVVIKSDGEPAYISGDLAYYLDKRSRGFDRCVIMLGADHHGYVGRMMAMCAAFGDTPGVNLEILIGQQVNLVRDGQPLRMSKRAGTGIRVEDLVDAIGVDAGRYALARSSSDSVIDIDLALWTSASNDNPVFYVQYAHARLSKLLRDAAERCIEVGEPDLTLLATEPENDLLRALGEYPRVVASAAELRSPHRVARYLEELAGTYHRFYDSCRVLPRAADDGGWESAGELERARLVLCAATRVVLANGLGLLGVSAPERM